MEGLGKFKEAFEAYSDNYVIIGGTACGIAMSGSSVKPRVTHDIEMLTCEDPPIPSQPRLRLDQVKNPENFLSL